MKTKIVCVATVFAAVQAMAVVVPTQSGSDYILTLDSGSDTCSTVLTGSGTLYKRGAGEVILDTASSGFSGSVVVEAGTLMISNVTAVGSSAPITVQSGATLWLKVPGKGSTVAFPHNVTIAGKGVDDKGAFRFTNTNAKGSPNGDSLLNKLTLSDDATIDVSNRWGMYGSKVIELNGHTLTRIGTSNWMMYGIFRSTGGPGEVNNVSGTLTFQTSPVIEENVTVVVTNIDSSSYISLWGASMGSSKGTIKVYNGRYIQASSGTSSTANHIGPLHLAGDAATVKLIPQYGSAARAMSVDGPVTSDSAVGLEVDGNGSVWFNSNVTVTANSTFKGSCNVYLCGANSARNMKWVLQGASTTTHEAGRTFLRMLRVANGGTASAALRQTGGSISLTSSDVGRIGESNGSRGYYTLEGGDMHVSNGVYMAEHKGSFGAFRQTGGSFKMKRDESTGLTFFIGRAGSGLLVQTGGTNDLLTVQKTQGNGVQMGTNDLCEATISGTGTLFRTSLFQMGSNNSLCTNILNIANGAVVKANRFRKSPTALPGTRAYVNADGATLMPTFSWGWTAAGYTDATFYRRSPDHFVIWKKGLVFDTSENAANNETSGSTGSTSLPFWFEAPTGKGVESVALPTDSGFVASNNASNYIGIARVVFEDATGWGASAYAEYDFSSKKVTKIVVTSRGCDYSDDAKAYLESPDRKTRYECALTLTSNEGLCGEFVKRGEPTLELLATNTITGGIAVEEGMLTACLPGVIPPNTPVRVESGATLNLNFHNGTTVSTFTGAGLVTNGEMTVVNAMRASCAELFDDKHATFAGNLTFAPGATFTITDPENLETYKRRGSVPAFTAATLSGTPTLAFEGSMDGSMKWSLFKKSNTTYNFGAIIGTAILVK